MREIKFRGKRIDNGDWVNGLLTHDCNEYNKDCLSISENWTEFYEVIPETVGQYTGLKDKNGVEIYSNDYVRWFGASGVEDAIGVVKWDNDKSAYVVYVDDYNEHYLYDVYYADMVVIGNIHEK